MLGYPISPNPHNTHTEINQLQEKEKEKNQLQEKEKEKKTPTTTDNSIIMETVPLERAPLLYVA